MKIKRQFVRIFLLILLFLFVAVSNPAYASDKPIFVTITAEKNCTACQKFKPVLEELKNEYEGKIDFVTLDISSKSSLEESRQKAKESGVSVFFEENKGLVPRVGILCPGGSKTEKLLTGEIRKEVYIEELNYILFDTTTLCSL